MRPARDHPTKLYGIAKTHKFENLKDIHLKILNVTKLLSLTLYSKYYY